MRPRRSRSYGAVRASLGQVVLLALAAQVAAARAETVKVRIADLGFTPAVVTVKLGDRIEWVNEDSFDHTATVDGAWDVTIPANDSAGRTMEAVGSVEYYCRFHPNMTGRLTVTAR